MSCQCESLFFLRGHEQFLLNVQSGSRLRQIQKPGLNEITTTRTPDLGFVEGFGTMPENISFK